MDKIERSGVEIYGQGTIEGGAGDDFIMEHGTLIGGKGNDTIRVSIYDPDLGGANYSPNLIIFNLGDGKDTLENFNASGKDTIRFGAGITADMISFKLEDDDLIIIVNEDDQIRLRIDQSGLSKYHRVEFADGTVWNSLTDVVKNSYIATGNENIIQGGAFDDTIIGSSGDDCILDKGGSNFIDAGEGNNSVYLTLRNPDVNETAVPPYTNYNTIIAGSGNDTISIEGYNGGNELVIDAGDGDNDVYINIYEPNAEQLGATVGQNNTYIQTGSGKDNIHINNDHGHAFVESGTGNDNIAVYNKNAYIDAGTGDDQIFLAGFGTIIGGQGNDNITLKPHYSYDNSISEGKVVLNFNLGDGQDTLNNHRYQYNSQKIVETSGTTIINFGAGITADMVSLIQDPNNENNLIIKIGDHDSITLKDYYRIQTPDGYLPYQFHFDNGTIQSLTPPIMNHAPKAIDQLLATEFIENKAFQWELPIGSFIDEDVNDQLTYSAKLVDGSDLPSWLSIDSVTGTLSGTPAVTEKIAIIITATDKAGASASQTLHLNILPANHTPEAQGSLDAVEATANQELQWLLPTNSFIDQDQGDKLTYSAKLADGSSLPSWLSIDPTTGMLSGKPSDLTSVSVIITATDLVGASANHTLTINVKPNYIYGTNRNDRINGTTNHDHIIASAGNDTISDYIGNNYLDGGEGNDSISGNGTLIGGAGNDTLIGSGTFIGGIGNDSINMNVAGSSDTIIFNLGNGKDTITSVDTALAKGQDLIQFGAGISKEDISFQRNGKHLVILVGNQSDQITINNYFSGNANNTTINEIKLADGSSFNIQDNMILLGSKSADNITGSQWNDTIYGGAGNDIITDNEGINYLDGGEGNDRIVGIGTLVGGTGNDTLTGSGTFIGGVGNDSITMNIASSSDTFIFNLGDGKDTITSLDTATAKGQDVIKFGTGITVDNVSYKKSGSNLVLTIGNSNDQITIKNYFLGVNYSTITRLEFADGTVWQTNGQLNNSFAFTPIQNAYSASSASLENQATNLVDALASFAPASSSNTLIDESKLDLNSVVIAVN